MKPLNKVSFLVVHCADTKTDMDTTVEDLRKWHVEENGWNDIGYHHFIKFDGSTHECRSEAFEGAHCKAVNDKSIAVCLEGGYGGEDNFTHAQSQALVKLVKQKKDENPDIIVVGHNHFDDKKCPCFSVAQWYDNNLKQKWWQ